MLSGRAQPERELDFYDIKGALESAVEAMNLSPLEFEAAEIKHLRPGQSAAVSFGGARVGCIGRLSEAAAGQYKFRQPVFVAEVDLTALLASSELPVLYSPLPRFPSIVRDVSLLVGQAHCPREQTCVPLGEQLFTLLIWLCSHSALIQHFVSGLPGLVSSGFWTDPLSSNHDLTFKPLLLSEKTLWNSDYMCNFARRSQRKF